MLLEPVMRVEVVVPEEYMGDVIGDLTSRRGHIQSMEARGGSQVINSRVPLSEMFGYATDSARARRAADRTRCTSIGTSRRRRR